jgi:hypothetical protein
MMEKKDYLMMGTAVVALVGLLIYRGGIVSRPTVLGSGSEVDQPPWLMFLLVVGGGGLLAVLVAVLITRVLRKSRAEKYQAEINQRVASGPTIFLLPRSDARPVDPTKINLWARLADALPHDEHLAFEVSGNEIEIGFSVHGSEKGLRAALTQIRSEWPGVQQRPVEEEPTELPPGWSIWWCECAPNNWNKPVTALTDDPLRSVLIEMKGIVGQGRGLVQVIARNDFGTRKQLGQAAFAARADKPDNAGVRALRTREAKELETRADRTFLQATIRTVGMADTEERAQGIARGLARAVTASFGHSNPVKRVQEGIQSESIATRQMGQIGVWADNELAHLGHLVGKDILFTVPRLLVASAKSLPAAPIMRITPFDQIATFAEVQA